MSYIRLVNVTKQFGDVTAVNNHQAAAKLPPCVW